MGADEYKRFCDAGGRAAYFLLVFNEFAQRTTEMFEGKD